MLHSRWLCLMMVVLGLQACAPSLRRPAPVEDRVGAPRAMPSSAPSSASATEPGTYVVQRGDTLAKIALDHGVSWRDVARWNQLDNPDVIEVGQVFSIEPGIYQQGVGGVRIENLCTVVQDPEHEGFLCVEALTFSPLDERLIDPALLDAAERAFLDGYRARWRPKNP